MKDILDYCIKNKITVSQYALMYLLSTQTEEYTLEYVRNCGKFNVDELKILVQKNYLLPFDENNITFENLKLTDKFERKITEKISIEELSKKYVELFPKGIKSGGYYVKTNYKSCAKKLKKFLEDYPEFTPEIILKATENYVADMAERNYDKMRLAPYFIEKDGISGLWTYCDKIVNSNNYEHEDDPWKIKA
ncbi:MAG: hypothetical protein QXL18_01715 [Candidatus Woesearchaeota archaeon]